MVIMKCSAGEHCESKVYLFKKPATAHVVSRQCQNSQNAAYSLRSSSSTACGVCCPQTWISECVEVCVAGLDCFYEEDRF